MKESVSAVFISNTKVYFTKRQNYLPVFQGYHATPGGKVDETDLETPLTNPLWPKDIRPKILHALIREIKEELNYDIEQGIIDGEVQSIYNLGNAVSPDFNPYHFTTHYIKITLTDEIPFQVDFNEAVFGVWKKPIEFLNEYFEGKILAVPPTLKLLQVLAKDIKHNLPVELSLKKSLDEEMPVFEPLCGVRQLLPLSNTFPPANRTNAFIIGDEGTRKILVDPSPKNDVELKKFSDAITKIGFDAIFLTHHHPDHYQYARELALKFKVEIELSQYTFDRIGAQYFEGIKTSIKKEGDIVATYLGEEVKVYEVPGHDEGQLGLAPKSLSWFLVGDLIQTVGTVVIGAPEGDMKKYFHSLERVIKLNPRYIIPSHGIVIGGTHKLEETLKHRKIREEQIIELLKLNKSEEEVLKIIYVGISDFLMPYAKKTLDAHLLKLKTEKRI